MKAAAACKSARMHALRVQCAWSGRAARASGIGCVWGAHAAAAAGSPSNDADGGHRNCTLPRQEESRKKDKCDESDSEASARAACSAVQCCGGGGGAPPWSSERPVIPTQAHEYRERRKGDRRNRARAVYLRNTRLSTAQRARRPLYTYLPPRSGGVPRASLARSLARAPGSTQLAGPFAPPLLNRVPSAHPCTYPLISDAPQTHTHTPVRARIRYWGPLSASLSRAMRTYSPLRACRK